MSRPSQFFRPLDLLVLAAVSAGCAWGFLGFSLQPGGKAEVFVGGAKYGWYDLTGKAREVEVKTGIGTVRLRVGDGSARVIASPCRNKLCIKQGAVSRAHSELICMPARMLVILEVGPADRSGKGGNEPDAVTY